MNDEIGKQFQQQTKYDRRKALGPPPDWNLKPEVYKEYAGVDVVDLPKVNTAGDVTLDDALKNRASVRDFADESISVEQIAYLLWASTGIREEVGTYQFRTAPSAGALYPIETYLVVNNVGGLVRGLYHYRIRHHSLELLRIADLRVDMASAALDQEMCAEAAAVFVWTAMFERTLWKYRQRGYRYIYMDAGHIAENLALAATALDLGSCQIGALFDDECNGLIGIEDSSESVIYMSAVGKPK